MKRFVMGMGLAIGLMAGCSATEPRVSSVTSAVEGVGAPEDDMRISSRLNYYCHTNCLRSVGGCYSQCSNEDTEVLCDGQCEDALANCHEMCERVFPWGGVL